MLFDDMPYTRVPLPIPGSQQREPDAQGPVAGLIHVEDASRRDVSVDPVEELTGAVESTLGELSELESDEDLSYADGP